MTSEFVFDVTTDSFESSVLARSQLTPVLLDFWADWCGPCKTLRPVLDKLAEEYGGAFVLGAVDTEKEQQLAYAFQVQSIPFCVLLVGGKPVNAFQGALPEAEVRKFLADNGIEPAAAAAEQGGEEAPPEHPVEVARAALFRGDWESAKAALTGLPEEDERAGEAARITAGLSIFSTDLSGDEAPAADAARRGRDAFAAGQVAAAAEAWFESLEHDRAWREQLARRAIVMAFEVLSVNDAGREYVREMRSRLATLLY